MAVLEKNAWAVFRDLGGQTYIFNDASLYGTYDPQPSDIVLFSIESTTENASSRNP